MLVFHLVVTGSIPAASIFSSKTNPAKSYAMFKNKNKKSRTHNICVPGIMGTPNITTFYAKHHPSKQTQQKVMDCSEILSPIIQTHKNPPPNP
jgi:hypothetical protein